MFLTRENDIFAFQNIAIATRETSRKGHALHVSTPYSRAT